MILWAQASPHTIVASTGPVCGSKGSPGLLSQRSEGIAHGGALSDSIGARSKAEEFYDRSEPLEIDDLPARAESLVRADLTRPAAEVFEEILKRRPDDAGPLKKLAFIRLGLKQWTSALELTGRLIAIPSEAVFGVTMAGIAYYESKNYDQSVAASVRVLEIDPDLKQIPLPKSLFWQNLAKDLIPGPSR